MTSQLETAIALARSLSPSGQRELLNVLSKLLNESETEDDFEPSVEEIAASTQRALHEVRTGQTKPISQLWKDLDEEDQQLLQLLKPGAPYEIWSTIGTHEAAGQLAELLKQDEQNH